MPDNLSNWEGLRIEATQSQEHLDLLENLQGRFANLTKEQQACVDAVRDFTAKIDEIQTLSEEGRQELTSRIVFKWGKEGVSEVRCASEYCRCNHQEHPCECPSPRIGSALDSVSLDAFKGLDGKSFGLVPVTAEQIRSDREWGRSLDIRGQV